MKAQIKNFNTNELIATLKIDEKGKKNISFSDIMSQIQTFQNACDFLGIKKNNEELYQSGGFGFGINRCYEVDGMFSSARPVSKYAGITLTGKSSSIINNCPDTKILEPDFVKVINKKTGDVRELDLKIEVIVYQEGYVISSGKNCTNIFGGSHPAYFSKITSRNFKCCSLGGAKLFATPDAAIKYVEKNRDVFEYMVSHYGYYFEFDHANLYFKEDQMALTEKKKEKLACGFEQIKELFNKINSVDEEEEEIAVPETTNIELSKAEAVLRMKNLNIMQEIIKRYEEKDEILFSEFGGILYDLNEEAKEAVAKVKEKGFLPYHVIRSQTEFGDVYAVLYVSNQTEEWKSERRDKNGTIYSYVYNATNPSFSEFGSIMVESCNGGLLRTA